MSTILSLMILVGGISMTKATGLIQRKLWAGMKCIFAKEEGKGELSSFGALCTTLAATLGTGNIVGVATAVTAGGPGALFWMVAASFLCMALKFAECALAVVYRRPTATGYEGGPVYYIKHGMGRGWASAFALCGAAAGALGLGTLTRAEGIVSLLQQNLDGEKRYALGGVPLVGMAVAAVVTLLAGLVLWGGVQRISTVCETVVPVMAVGYILCCCLILLRSAHRLPWALGEIVKGAFSLRAGWGGLLGTVSVGISRGIFSNEAGLGSAPIASAAAKGNSPLRQGLIGQSGVFIDTTLMCTLSGLCVVVTGAADSGRDGAAVTALAFEQVLGSRSTALLGVFLCFFAFTTIVGWYYYAGRCFVYLAGGKGEKLFRLLYVGMILLTPLLDTQRIWNLADLLNAGMALPNLLALWKLRGQVALLKSDK